MTPHAARQKGLGRCDKLRILRWEISLGYLSGARRVEMVALLEGEWGSPLDTSSGLLMSQTKN